MHSLTILKEIPGHGGRTAHTALERVGFALQGFRRAGGLDKLVLATCYFRGSSAASSPTCAFIAGIL